tara:strand:- start:2704 stop:3411 length:708 start_codon:yes stop_codon:yes gene_type:complete
VKQFLRQEENNGGENMVTGHFQEFEDEYLETLYNFHEKNPGKRVKNGELSTYLDVSPASVTEMIQRLSRNGFVDYIPYKGALLTESGIEHGQMIKRRHRLAEVLLTLLPFEGDVHETACVMEHAIDDDLEICLTNILGNPQFDPSGQKIPEPCDRIAEKLTGNSMVKPLAKMNNDEESEIILIMITASERTAIAQMGIAIGSKIIKKADSLFIDDSEILISEVFSKQIIVRCLDD